MIKLILTIIFLANTTQVFSKEFMYLARSPRALLMGDAFTARADDDFSLFYNPAALARVKGIAFHPLNPELGATNVLKELDRFEDFPSSASGISDRLMGFPLYLKFGAFPTLKMGGFGMTLFASSTTSIVVRNKTHPILDIDYRYDRGFAMGYAYEFGKTRRRSGDKGAMPSTSVGFGFKYIEREGIDETFNLFGTRLLSLINDSDTSDYSELRNALGYSKAKGWGLDLGIEHGIDLVGGNLNFGLSVLDLFDTRLKRKTGTAKIPAQEMAVNAGMTWSQDFGFFDYSISTDLHPINQYDDFGRLFRLGVEAGIPFLKVFTGMSQGYLSYGVELDFKAIKVVAGLYGVEIGSKFKEEEASRAIIYFSLFDFTFDL